MRNGSIPAKLVIFLRPEKTFQHPNGESLTTRPAYVGDAERDWCRERGSSWAEGPRWSKAKNEVETLEVPNTPFEYLRIIDLDIRSEGGRAFKVLTAEGYLVDLREDALMDIMLHDGVEPGGLLRGKFLWVMNGSQMRIARVGSRIHQQLQAKTKTQAKKKIPLGDLVTGGIYRSASGNTAVYLGRAIRDKKRYLAWVPLWNYQDRQEDFHLNDRYAVLTTSHSYIEQVEQMEIPPETYKRIERVESGGDGWNWDSSVEGITWVAQS